MDASRLEIEPGVWLDSRRAAYLEQEKVLCVADLHLGYAWAHRFSGQMLPLSGEESLVQRLSDLCAFYKPDRLAVLGDIVHRAVPVREVASDFSTLVSRVRDHCRLELILGNHDRHLEELVAGLGLDIEFHSCRRTGRFILVHGNDDCERTAGSTVIMGHEHPAISLGDNVRSARFPCFVAGPGLVILPAFSHWASGSDIRARSWMSPIARQARTAAAVAILGERLLRVAWEN